eukprot:6214243-Pleurochrysis_carterae.AAC.2
MGRSDLDLALSASVEETEEAVRSEAVTRPNFVNRRNAQNLPPFSASPTAVRFLRCSHQLPTSLREGKSASSQQRCGSPIPNNGSSGGCALRCLLHETVELQPQRHSLSEVQTRGDAWRKLQRRRKLALMHERLNLGVDTRSDGIRHGIHTAQGAHVPSGGRRAVASVVH